MFTGPFSVSNCATSYDEFQFKFWTITKTSLPGEFNKCFTHIDETNLPVCGTEKSLATTFCKTEHGQINSDANQQSHTVASSCDSNNNVQDSQATT